MIIQAHWHTSWLPEDKLCREEAFFWYLVSKEAEGNGLSLGVGSPVSFFCILTRMLQKEATPFLWWVHISLVLTFPNIFLIHCYPQIRCYLLIPKINFAIMQPWTEKIEAYTPFSPSFLSKKCLSSTLMSRRRSFFKLGSGWSHMYFSNHIRVVSQLNYLIWIYFKIDIFLLINCPSICPSEVGVLGYLCLSQTQYGGHRLSQRLISR